MKATVGRDKYAFRSEVDEDGKQFNVANIKIADPVPKEIVVEILDVERSRHDFNGKICIDVENLIENQMLRDIWVP